MSQTILANPSLLYTQNLLDESFYLIGCGRKEFSDEEFREKAGQSIQDNSDYISSTELKAFTSKLYYVIGDYDDARFYERIKNRIAELDKI